MAQKIARLPKWAELAFAGRCAAEGVFAHPPDEDQNGWDYLLEFPIQNHPGPADTQPVSQSAYVQIKSTANGKLSCRIKLSNALKAAQSIQPWFVVLVAAPPKQSNTEIYALHLWDEYIRRALKAVRLAENSGRPLNQSYLQISFSPDDRHDDDLISWMKKTIDTHTPDYEQKKYRLYSEAGYERGRYIGNFTINSANIDEIAKNFLGLGSGLPISQFTVRTTRFGIDSHQAMVDYTGEGKIIITPNAVDTCEIRFRAEDKFYSLRGQVFAAGAPVFSRQEMRVRFSAEIIEIVASANDGKAKIKAAIDPRTDYSLYAIEAFAAFNASAENRTPIAVQVWARGRRVIGGTFSLINERYCGWSNLLHAVGALRQIQGSDADTVRVSVIDLNLGDKRLAMFTAGIVAPSIRLEIVPTEKIPEKVGSLIFYSYAEVGSYLFFALCECSLVDEVHIGARWQLNFGPVKKIDSYVIENPSHEQREQMERDYKRYLEARERDGHPAGIGELVAFAEQTTESGSITSSANT